MPSRDKPKLVSSTPVAVWNEAPPAKAHSRRSLKQSLKDVLFAPLTRWLVAFGTFAAILCSMSLWGGMLWWLLAFTFLVGVSLISYMTSTFGRLPSSELLALMERLGLSNGQPTVMLVDVGGSPQGYDEGVTVFEGGMLRFYGLRTTFRLSPNVVYAPGAGYENGPFESRARKFPVMGDHAKGTAQAFGLRDHPDTTVWLLPVGGRAEQATFGRSLYRWLTGPLVAQDNSILPPLEPMPNRRKAEPSWFGRLIRRMTGRLG